MRRRISSSTTVLYKIILLILIVIMIAVNLFRTLYHPDTLQIFLASLSMLLGFFIARGALNWKEVELTEKGIIIASTNFVNYKEIFVPFEQIELVHQSFLTRGNPEFVSIEFFESTSFGKKIWFLPKSRFFTFTNHPIVAELNQLVNKTNRFIT
jgi:hypothetical protein